MDLAAGTGSTPRLSDRYLLGDVLGVGGTATVYRATHRETGLDVAVKIYTSGVVGPDALPSHRSETAAQAELRHPGLVEIYESGFDADRAYLVMRLVEGRSLAARLARGPLPFRDVAAIGAALADALAHVHAQGVVHRDIKPSNILLDAQQVPFLTDFGVSRLVDATRATATGMIVGTPAFMAPEQVRGHHVGPATDVYALGLVLLEAVTGRREYEGGVVESAVARLHRDPVVPSGLPEPHRRLLVAMTAQDPASRPSAATVAARLRAGPGAPPDATAWLVRTRPGRRQGALVAAAAATVLLAAATLGLANLDASATTTTATAPPSPAVSGPQPPGAESPTPAVPAVAAGALLRDSAAVAETVRPRNNVRTAVTPERASGRATSVTRPDPIQVHRPGGSGGKSAKGNGKKPNKDRKR